MLNTTCYKYRFTSLTPNATHRSLRFHHLSTHPVVVVFSYFKDQPLLSRVPYVFLLTGGIYTVLQLVAIAGMIRKPVPKEDGIANSQDDGLELQVGTPDYGPGDQCNH